MSTSCDGDDTKNWFTQMKMSTASSSCFIILTVPHAHCDVEAGPGRTCDLAALPMARAILERLEEWQPGRAQMIASKQNRHLDFDDNRPIALLARSPFWEELSEALKQRLFEEKCDHVIVLDVHSFNSGLGENVTQPCAVLDTNDDLGTFGQHLCDALNDSGDGCHPVSLKPGRNTINEMLRTTVSASTLLEVSEDLCLTPDLSTLSPKGRSVANTVASFLHQRRSSILPRKQIEGLGPRAHTNNLFLQ
jgi:hypothetical protein